MTTTATTRSAADVRSAIDNWRITAGVLAELPREPLAPACASGFRFGTKILTSAAEAAVQLDEAVGIRVFASRLHEEFSSAGQSEFALGVCLASNRVRYSAAQ